MMESDWGQICMVANAVIWALTFVFFQHKTRYFGAGSFILFLYTVISILAVGLYNNKYDPIERDISLFPFIYLYLMIMIVSSPIQTIRERNLKEIYCPTERLFKFVCWSIIAFSIIILPKTIISLRENILQIIMGDALGAELYSKNSEAYATKTTSQFNILAILGHLSGEAAMVFFMYYITQKSRNKLLLYGLGICSLFGPLGSVANGVRATIAVFILNSLCLFIFIRNLLPNQIKKKITRSIAIVGLMMVVPIASITIGRNYGDIDKSMAMVQSYAAQGMILFNNYGLDPGGTRNGDYTAVAFKYAAGMKPAMYYSGRLSRYWHMKINESRFYTFVGDFTLDYGPFGACVVFIFTALFFRKCLHISHGRMAFHQYLMFYLLMKGCLGYYQFSLGRESGNLEMIFILMLALLFKLASDYNTRKHRTINATICFSGDGHI